jgi:hypothetical protein
MNFYFTPWSIKESEDRLLVQIIDVSGATIADNLEKPYAELIINSVNTKTGGK